MIHRGFTLLELLFAIALMALVMGTLYSSLYIGSKAHASATQAIQAPRTAALAMELLAQDFDAALPPTAVLAGSFTGTSGGMGGSGSYDSLTFFSCAHAPKEGETACDIRQVDLTVETMADDDRPVLLRRLTTNLLASQVPLVREQVICRRVKSFSARYFDGIEWQTSWDSTTLNNVLPCAVELTLEFAVDGTRGAPEQTYRVVRVFNVECGTSTQNSD